MLLLSTVIRIVMGVFIMFTIYIAGKNAHDYLKSMRAIYFSCLNYLFIN